MKENKEEFEARMKAEGWSKTGFGWMKKTKLGCKIYYNKQPSINKIPHNFLGRGRNQQILTKRGDLRKKGRGRGRRNNGKV
ncbi:MAG: hypothetical protein ACW98X_17765 [Promethearchaeota archaeon]|jgi:hypothetical protein